MDVWMFIVAGSFQMNIIWLICSWLFLFSQDDIEDNEEARGCLALSVDHCYYKLQTFAVTTTVTAMELSKKHSPTAKSKRLQHSVQQYFFCLLVLPFSFSSRVTKL